MRSIESKIIEKLETTGENIFNLSVRDTVEIKNSEAVYYLWKSPVVKITADENGNKTIYFSFCGWQSLTTKSRIDCILYRFKRFHVFQKNWQLYLVGCLTSKSYKIEAEKSYYIKDNNLYDSETNEIVKEI